jgi:hypothetical protein
MKLVICNPISITYKSKKQTNKQNHTFSNKNTNKPELKSLLRQVYEEAGWKNKWN